MSTGKSRCERKFIGSYFFAGIRRRVKEMYTDFLKV
jgi:hypothetical protein